MADDRLFFELVDRANSLGKYDFFLKNMHAETSLEKEVENFLKKKKVVRVLDLGCGEAGALKDLKKMFGKKVFVAGIDLIKTEGLDSFVEGDTLEADFPKDIDIAVSFRAMHEFHPIEKVFEKLCQSLSAGGKAFLSVRCQQFLGDRLLFHGSLTSADMDFLKSLAKKNEFLGVKVKAVEVKEKKNVVFFDPKTARKPPAQLEIIHGINFFLEKP